MHAQERGQRRDEGGRAGLQKRIEELLRSHHVMTVATVASSPDGASSPDTSPASEEAAPPAAASPHVTPSPHAAPVFYAADRHMRLVFLSKGSSRHATHIQSGSPVAVAVSGEYDDWRDIRGVQMWGSAEVLRGAARAAALSLYVARFPFVRGVLNDPNLKERLEGIEVIRFTPVRADLTDNTKGLFGREVLVLDGDESRT